MGGGLAMMLAVQRADDVKAVAPFYGVIPWEGAEPDWSKLQAPLRGHFAEKDGFFTPDKAKALEQRLRDLGKDATIEVHPGVDHAFFNDTRPEVYNETEASRAWADTLAFFRDTVR
jgi:carboxymethylenebutenolidase